jgi:glycosyltransferase involved in cell wall biosynthesis
MGALVAASIVMPVGDVHEYILPAAQSILAQSAPDLELIVVDDSGQPALLRAALHSLLHDHRIKLVPCQGKGISDALNTGTDHAVGQFWFRCDSDDIYPPGRIASQIAYLQQNPDFGAVTGAMSAMDPDGKFVANMNRQDSSQEITDELRKGLTRSSLCSWAVRMELIRGSGGFRRYFATAEDIDMQLRLGERCRVWYETQVRYRYRLHARSITHNQASLRLVFFDSIARDFQRERLAGGRDALDLGIAPPPPEWSAVTPSQSRIQDLIIGTSWDQHRSGKRLHAIRTGLRAVTYGPLNFNAWRNLAALVVKPIPRSDPKNPGQNPAEQPLKNLGEK